MSKRRSSIRGKGAEILFGNPPTVAIEPRSSESANAEAGTVEPDAPQPEPLVEPLSDAEVEAPPPPLDSESLLGEPDLEMALYEEARAGESGPEDGDGDPLIAERGLLPRPELESPVEEATEAVEPVEPVVEEAVVIEEPPDAFVEETLEAAEPLEPPAEEATEAVEPVELVVEEAVVIEEPPDAFVEEALALEEPSEALEEIPTSALEETMDESDLLETEALFELPPPETSDLGSGVLPPRPSEPAFDMADLDLEDADIQAPDEPVEQPELPDRALTEEEQEQLLARLEVARFRKLDEQISRAYDQVLSKVGDSSQITAECHNLLLKARDIVLHRDASKVPQAEYFVEQVRARLRRAAESEAAAKKYAWLIAGWGLLWFAIYVTALISLSFAGVQEMIATATADDLVVNMGILLPAMLWGGIGGVAAVFYSLFKHVGRRDFDSQYNLSYVGKPFLGIILGATVYMVVHLMTLTLGILPGGLLGGEADSSPTIMPWLIYLLAWASGFKENRIFDLVDRVVKQVFGGARTEPSAEPPA